MGKFDSVKSIIDAYIKENGHEEITGEILNNVLHQMLDDIDVAIGEGGSTPGGDVPGGESVNVEGSEFIEVKGGKVSLIVDPQGGLGATQQGLGIVDIPASALGDMPDKTYVDAAARAAYEQAYNDSVDASKNYTDNLESDIQKNPESYVPLKTINGQSIFGLGNIEITGGGGGGGENTTDQYRVRFVNYTDGTTIYVSKEDKADLKFAIYPEIKYAYTSSFVSTGEQLALTIAVKRPSDASFIDKATIMVDPEVVKTIDVSGYLADGSNQIRLTAVSNVYGTQGIMLYNAVRSSLSLSAPNFAWYNPATSAISIPYRVGGSLAKTLHVSVAGNGYSKSYAFDLGTTQYVDGAYPQQIEHPGKSGVFTISAYVQSNDGYFRTKDLVYQTIFVLAGDGGKYMAVNNVTDMLVNYETRKAFDYAVYNGGKAAMEVAFSVKKDGELLQNIVIDNAVTGASNELRIPLDVATIDSNNFHVSIEGRSGGVSLAPAVSIEVNNAFSFAAVPGAVFYMTPKGRDNSQSNRQTIINEMDGSSVYADWYGMNWGSDGYQVVNGVKVLRIFAGASVSIHYKPFEQESARVGRSIELDMMIDNVVDFEDVVLGVVKNVASSWLGVKIYPDKAVVFSQLQRIEDDQSFKFEDRTRMRLALVVMPDAYGNPGFNLVSMYVNGTKNREFTYANTDYFANDGNIVIGSDSADIDIYAIRVYETALSTDAVKQNYINLLDTIEEKRAFQEKNDVYAANGVDIDIEKVKALCNVIVFEGEMPSLANPNKFKNNWYFYWKDNPEWNCIVRNITQDGQGTSAKLYREWNQRGKVSSETITEYADGTPSTKGAFRFMPGRPLVKTFTFKLNWASSCQCNKMGSVNSINDLCDYLGILDPDGNPVAVYQRPFAGFQMTKDELGNAIYVFTGLYTGGVDKGDSNWMNWDYERYPNLISVEGAENGSPIANYRVPWNPASGRISFNMDEESLQYNGENGFDYNAGAAESASGILSLYEMVFRPFYNFVYECSPHIAYWDGTLASLNADAEALSANDVEYWLEGGGLYYYEAALNQFIPSDAGNGQINLYDQLVDKGYGITSASISGLSGDALNEMFKSARIAKFRAEASRYINVDQACFGVNWMEMLGSTDTRAKNTYWTLRGRIDDGYRLQFYWDDTDTIAPFTNQGQDKKPYWCEVGDRYANGQPVWNGEQSRFYNLMQLAFPSELEASMKAMLNAMVVLGGLSTGNKSSQLFAFFHKYYFSQAQEYFPSALYNATTRRLYEGAKLDPSYSNDTDPMTQALGDYYSGWKRWIKRRIQYIQSKYSWGDYSANGGDVISVRAAGNRISYEITPAIWMYPNVASGTSIIRGKRTEAGKVCNISITLSGAADQQNTIKGVHYLQSIGEWHDKNVTGAMTIRGRMLRELLLGHPTAAITISITSLILSETPSLRTIDLRRISTLGGVLDLSGCTHIKQLYAGGTALTAITLPNGGGLSYIGYPVTMQQIVLRNFPLLTNSGVDIDECKTGITDYMVVGCDRMKPLALLAEIMQSQASQGASHALKRIRATGINETYNSSEMLSTLVNLTDGSYAGLDANGIGGSVANPVLEGKVSINADAYQDEVEALQSFFGQDFIINITGQYFLRIVDAEVLRILLANGVGSDGGVTEQQAEAVTTIGTWFQGNTEITSFDEFRFFVNVQLPDGGSASSSTFGQSTLRYITLADTLRVIGARSFVLCEKLERVSGLDNITSIGINAFFSTSSLAMTINLPNLASIGTGAFCYSGIVGITNLGSITSIPGGGVEAGAFSRCYSLEHATLPASLQSIGERAFLDNTSLKNVLINSEVLATIGLGAFYGCSALQSLILRTSTPPSLGANVFGSTNSTFVIYVPDASVDAYKAATNWSTYASRIKPLSEYNI